MPVSVVVGAQYGSEGKGKVADYLARTMEAEAVVRVGGPNSGHTVVRSGETTVFQQLPTAAGEVPLSVLPPGSYLNIDILRAEIERSGVTPSKLAIDPRAVVITAEDITSETSSGLRQAIGSTASGTGAAVQRRVSRDGSLTTADDISELKPYLVDTSDLLRAMLSADKRIIVEGTQGFGLSLLHGMFGRYATSRDTTAAAFVSEAGLSPLDVDDVVLVARAFPIRVAGSSGPLDRETTWDVVGNRSGRKIEEFTTVTKRLRRVAEFEPEVVARAIAHNRPTRVVLNHVDYVSNLATAMGRQEAINFVSSVETQIGRSVDFVGIAPDALVATAEFASRPTQNQARRRDAS
ncbi:adenylosuccinate synthetase [Schumannella luteola]